MIRTYIKNNDGYEYKLLTFLFDSKLYYIHTSLCIGIEHGLLLLDYTFVFVF